MKILVTEQQLTHIVNELKLNEEHDDWYDLVDSLKDSVASKSRNIAQQLSNLKKLTTLKSTDVKASIKKILDLCEKFEYKGGFYYVFQQIPSVRPENVIFKDNRREIVLYVKPNATDSFDKNIIYYNKLLFNKLASNFKIEDVEYSIKYNIINVLIDENIITRESFLSGLKLYYESVKNNRDTTDPLYDWFDNFINKAVTSEILQKTGLKNLKDLDINSMKPDYFNDEGLSGFSKLKRNINRRLTGLSAKESYFISKLANIFDMAVKDEKNNGVFNIPDGDGENYKIFHSHKSSCSVFLRNNPAIYDDSLVSYFEEIGYKFADMVKTAADKSSNTELKKSIKNCALGSPIKIM